MSELTSFSISKAATLTGLSRRAVSEIMKPLPDDAGVEQIVAAFVTAVRAQIPDSTFQISTGDPNEPNLPRGVYSINALHQMFLLDRMTIEKRLRKQHVKPSYQKARVDGRAAVKGFRLTDKGKSGKTVRQILEADDDPKLTAVTIRDREASAKLKELDYEERTNTIRAEIMSEVRDEATKLLKALQTRFKLYWRENARRLRQCKSTSDLARTGETDQALILTELKRGYPEMFKA